MKEEVAFDSTHEFLLGVSEESNATNFSHSQDAIIPTFIQNLSFRCIS